MSTTATTQPAARTHPPPHITAGTVASIRDIALSFSKSDAFDGATAAALELRLWVGVALGLDPTTACTNVLVYRNKVVFSAALQTGLLAKSERYSCEVLEATDEKASIRFFRDGKPVGVSTFTIAEAKRAGLASKTVWQHYPSDLLFARAMTRGIRRFAPDLLAGNVSYTREEIGEDTHEAMPAPPRSRVKTPQKAEAVEATDASPPAEGNGVTEQQLKDLRCNKEALQIPADEWKKILAKRGVQSARELTREQAAELLMRLNARITTTLMAEELARQEKAAAKQHRGDLAVDVQTVGKGEEVNGAAGSDCKSE
jgi:hypothetical protein